MQKGRQMPVIETDVVSGEHFLTCHEQRRLAEVLRVEREVAAPADVSARAEYLHELALVVEQAGVTFRHQEGVAKVLELHHDHHEMACRAAARRAKAGASGRTRTDDYKFYKTRPVAAEAQRGEAATKGARTSVRRKVDQRTGLGNCPARVVRAHVPVE